MAAIFRISVSDVFSFVDKCWPCSSNNIFIFHRFWYITSLTVSVTPCDLKNSVVDTIVKISNIWQVYNQMREWESRRTDRADRIRTPTRMLHTPLPANVLLWSPCVIGQTIIFLPCGFFFLFSSPNLSGRRLDVYHTSSHSVALV